MWKNYFKIAYRNILRSKINTFINVISLTLGMAGALVIYTIVQYETGFDNFHSHSDQTYRVVQHNKTADGIQYWNTTAYPLAEALRQAFPDLKVTQTSGPITAKFSLTNSEKASHFEEDRIWFVDSYYLEVFDYKEAYDDHSIWISGDRDNAFRHPNAVVLTVTAAKRFFGGEAENPSGLIGQTLLLDENELMMVSGIIKDPPLSSNTPFEIILPYEYFKAHHKIQADSWEGNHQGTTYLVLPPETDPGHLSERIAALKTQYLSKEDNDRISYHLQPLNEIHSETLYGSSPGSYVTGQSIIYGLWLLGVLLVLVACLNYINLSTAKSLKRAKEVGIRKVLGSTKSQLFYQHMCEAFIITAFAFFIAYIMGDWVIGEINQVVNFASFSYPNDTVFYLLCVCLICGIAFLAGGYPGIVMTGFSPIMALKNKMGYTSKKGVPFRQSMIVFQFVIAQALIAGTLIMAYQMDFIQHKDLGYKKDDIINIKLQDLDPLKKDAFRQSLLQVPAVHRVSFSSGAPTTHERQYGTSFRRSYEPLEMRRESELKFIDREYFNLFDISILAGKLIQYKDEYDLSDGIVVNEVLVRSLGLTPKEAIGVALVTNEGKAPIAAVVEDFHNNALQEGIMPCIMVFWGNGFLDQASISISDSKDDFAAIYPQINDSWQKVYPNAELSYAFVKEELAGFYREEDYLFNVFQIAAGLAILIGCLGLYGLVVLVAQQRSKEIGIRKLIGASVTRLVTLLSWDFIKLIFVAVGLATPFIYYLMEIWLQGFAFRIDLQWWYFLVAGLVTLLIAILTVSVQASKTALMNPVNALKSE